MEVVVSFVSGKAVGGGEVASPVPTTMTLGGQHAYC